MYFKDGIVYYTVKPLCKKTLHQRFVTSVAYFFSLYLTVFTIAIPFVYRYCVLCRNYVMGNRAFALLVVFEVLTSALAALALYCFWWPSVQDTTALTVAMNFTCTDDGRIPHYTFDDATSLRIAGILMMYLILTGLHYVVMVACSWTIWKKVKGSSKMSRRTAAINQQLNRVLALQAMTPFFIAIVPIVVCLVGLIFSVQWLGRVLELSTSLVSWLPIMNPVFSMCFVKAYRRAIVIAFAGTLRSAMTPLWSRSSDAPLPALENAATE